MRHSRVQSGHFIPRVPPVPAADMFQTVKPTVRRFSLVVAQTPEARSRPPHLARGEPFCH